MPDLFELLREKLGCEYISDLRQPRYLAESRRMVARLSLDEYSLFALSDVAEYLYGEKISFDSVEQAKIFFSRQMN